MEKSNLPLVYERHDGRIFVRRIGEDPSMRKDITDEFDDDATPNSLVTQMRENQLWRDIREAAKTNSALQNLLEQAKVLYYLGKDNGTRY